MTSTSINTNPQEPMLNQTLNPSMDNHHHATHAIQVEHASSLPSIHSIQALSHHPQQQDQNSPVLPKIATLQQQSQVSHLQMDEKKNEAAPLNSKSLNGSLKIETKRGNTPDEQVKKETERMVPNAKTITTTQSNGATTTKQNMTTPTCKNCKTQTTPLWRRDESGQVLCNACGLFLKLHGRPRPISLKSDVIKSRNRVKHNNKSSPNTPELKAKDSNNGIGANGQAANNSNGTMNSKNSTKFLPKQYKPNNKSSKTKKCNSKDTKSSKNKKEDDNITNHNSNNISNSNNNANINSMTHLSSITSPNLLPLLPRNHLGASTLPPGTPYTYGTPTNPWLNKSQATNIQSLHYPSSTPTHFVSDLNRITSPLLLSTANPPKLNVTPSQSQSSERSSSVNGVNQQGMNLNRDAVLNAAGALEILSQHSTNSNDLIPGMRLNSPRVTPVSKGNSFSEKLPPISLLQSKEFDNTKSEPTHLHNLLSPQLNNAVRNNPKTLSSSNPQLPSLRNVPGISSVIFSSDEQPRSLSMNNLPNESNGDVSALNINNGPINSSILQEENELLKTRINELELVNELYKTRIADLESLDSINRETIKELEMQIQKSNKRLAEENDNFDRLHSDKKVKVEDQN
ncbi:GATA type zinc finger protein asd-4 [Pichia kudriavzevii]|uniref:GATA type zinc finger protein asd-4 n=1 Tax=Pichia kudriavzevii TaxID=4909 RepID=A0A1V2LTG9_PICKU|nr:GATA type zinc finger protein asd-4 [Pichia kudriavzevii]